MCVCLEGKVLGLFVGLGKRSFYSVCFVFPKILYKTKRQRQTVSGSAKPGKSADTHNKKSTTAPIYFPAMLYIDSPGYCFQALVQKLEIPSGSPLQVRGDGLEGGGVQKIKGRF